ncbi:peptidase M61 [Aquimarina sp. AU474]|uniref:M61 family metallopeptidase n=1 Tax=Aquimarina sp. AU474 TaxID=2108529 RepID=UPI001F3EB3E9|nr:peptidase M61 [Aquimarina sp. AU474]
MQRLTKLLTNLALSISILYAATGCKSVQHITPEKNTSSIIASIDLLGTKDDKVKVEIKPEYFTTDTISYYIPKIVPGTYQNNNYGKYIDDFNAFDKEGKPLYVQKYGENRWKINGAKQLDKITYWVNDTFDSEDTHEIFSPTGTNISKDKNFILNLYAFVGYFDGMTENKYKLFIKHPKNLEASTSVDEIIPENKGENINYDVDFFLFKRYADVVDSPIMYSDPDRVTFTVNGIEILLSVYSPNKVHKAARIMPQMERMIRAQRNFLGDINATKKYSVLLYLSTTKQDDALGFGALEHNTSTLVVLPESISKKKLNESLTDVVSHEFFHIVTPLTIHSKEIHNFDYNTPKMSEHIWLYEGTTEYFSILFQITQGLIAKEDFFERILEKIEISNAFDNTMSFTEMSKNILVEPYRKNYRNVYEKGALISMCIDIIMREKSNGEYGIVDLMRNLSSEFGSNRPFEDDELIQTIREFSYPEIGVFLENHVVNGNPIDYEFYLKKVGLQFGTTTLKSSYFINGQQPFVKGSETTKEVVFESNIQYNNFLKNLGVQGGDVLLSIDDKKYDIKNIYDLFGDSNQWKIGDTISFKVNRDGKEMILSSEVIEPTIEKRILESNPTASEQQIKFLKSWVND